MSYDFKFIVSTNILVTYFPIEIICVKKLFFFTIVMSLNDDQNVSDQKDFVNFLLYGDSSQEGILDEDSDRDVLRLWMRSIYLSILWPFAQALHKRKTKN